MWDKPEIMLWLADLLYALAAILLLYTVLFVLIHLPLFPVREIRVNGQLHHVTRQQVQYIVNRELVGNFFTLDLNRMKNGFEKLPWVSRASVRRRWPDRLEVTLAEHVALARWAAVGLVDTQGKRFDGATEQWLPVFYGPPGDAQMTAKRYQWFQRVLAPTHLTISMVVLSARGSWELRFRNGLIAELGRDHVDQRVLRLAEVYRPILAALPIPVRYVDLRYSNGLAVRMASRSRHHSLGSRTAAGKSHRPDGRKLK